MELWVRSQDRESLCTINGIAVDDNTVITVSLTLKNIFTLGTYKSKERALEVLDDIQNTMIKTLDTFIQQTDNCAVGYSQFAFYEMPKE